MNFSNSFQKFLNELHCVTSASLKGLLPRKMDMINNKKFNFQMSQIDSLKTHPIHYALVKGIEKEKTVELLGVYDSLGKLQDAYVIAFQKLEEQHKNMTGLLGSQVSYIVEHEKVMINIFDEFTGRWRYNTSPDQLFWKG